MSPARSTSVTAWGRIRAHRLPPEHHLLFLSTPDNPDLPSPIYSQNDPVRGLSPCPPDSLGCPTSWTYWMARGTPQRTQERTPKNQPFGTHTDGELGPLTPGHTMFICNGKIMDKPPSSENLPPPEFAIWAEVGIYPCVLENYLPFLLRLGVQMMQQSHSQANIPKQWMLCSKCYVCLWPASL